jgi:putative glutamine amidotransferase
VNSFHHQSLDRLAESLVPVAYASDGVVEAVEGRTPHFVLAVQWHPEDMFHEDTKMMGLFKAFVAYIQQNQVDAQ